MTPEEWIAKYSRVGKTIRERRIIFLAATGTMDVMSRRIWDLGGLTDGGTLSYDEDYEVYAYRPPAPRAVSGRGKPYDQWTRPAPKKGKAAKIKGGWYPTYLAFKQQQGRKDNPFELTADLRKAWAGGVTPKPTEVDPLTCVIGLSTKESKKAEGLADKKGTFLELTAFEIKDHAKRVKDLYGDILAA